MNHTHGNWPTGTCSVYEAEGQPCSGWRRLEAEVERLRAENSRLRAQVAEYFAEPDTHPVEREG